MVGYTCVEFRDQLQQIQLLSARAAMQHGVPPSVNNSLGMFERYNPDTCTFFTPVGEMGILPWEMQRVFGLHVGAFPYEEHVPRSI